MPPKKKSRSDVPQEPAPELPPDGEWYELKPREFRVTKTPTFEQYDSAAHTLAKMRDNGPFWIGDFVNFGEDTFGEMYSQVLRHFGEYEYQTVANYSSVMRRVPARVGARPHRKEELSFAHHDSVAKLPHTEQSYWLERALAEGLTSRQLRDLINPPEQGEERSFGAELESLILRIQEIMAIAPAEAKPYLKNAMDILRDIPGAIRHSAEQPAGEGTAEAVLSA